MKRINIVYVVLPKRWCCVADFLFLFQVYVLQPGGVSAEGEELGEEDVPFQHLLVHPPGRRGNHVQGAG